MEDKNIEYIYRRYRDLVMDEAYNVLKDYHLAQDVCQEVFVKMSFFKLETLKTSTDVKRYLRVVAHHRAVDYYRMMECQAREAESLYFRKRREYPEDMDQMIDKRNLMLSMFQALKDKNKQWYEIVIRIGLYDDAPEIVARDLGISITLLRTKYHRAKNWMRKNYEEEYEFLIEY